ncbi:hypothetical protein [Bacillus sp. 179-C3.3 HS]|uniref:hypothetical protein n=1 Tax=Bacillus sp. 179-C3.3 HS TaxID=3232162 RepID=UPI0039A1F30E
MKKWLVTSTAAFILIMTGVFVDHSTQIDQQSAHSHNDGTIIQKGDRGTNP